MMNSKPARISPLLVLFFGIFAVSTSSIFIRFGQREASSLAIAANRLSFAAIILLVIAWRTQRADLHRWQPRQVFLVVLSGIFLAFHFATWITSLEYTSIASSVVLVSTTPLWVGLLSPLVLRERPSTAVAIGLMVALAGGILVGMSEVCTLQAGGILCPPIGHFLRAETSLGNLLALAGAAFGGGYLMIGRRLRVNMALMVYITSVYSIAAVVLVAMALISGQVLVGFSAFTYLIFLVLAVVPQLLGHGSFNYALGYLPAAFVSVALLGEPIGSTLLALVFLKETPTILEVVGGIIILVGIYLAARAQPHE